MSVFLCFGSVYLCECGCLCVCVDCLPTCVCIWMPLAILVDIREEEDVRSSLWLYMFSFKAGLLLGPKPFIVSSGSKDSKSLRLSSAQSRVTVVNWYYPCCLGVDIQTLVITIAQQALQGFTFMKDYRRVFNLQVIMLSFLYVLNWYTQLLLLWVYGVSVVVYKLIV